MKSYRMWREACGSARGAFSLVDRQAEEAFDMKYLKYVVLAAGLAFAAAGGASATTIKSQDYDGNDCAGVFGGTRGTVCKDPIYNSPIIAKVNFEKDDTDQAWGKDADDNVVPLNPVWEISSSFTSVLKTMFSFSFTADGKTGTWTYAQCADCPGITSYVAKFGNKFTHYYTDPQTAILSGSWSVSQGLSHLSFYDTDPPPIPLPAGGLLLVTALGGLVIARRRKKA